MPVSNCYATIRTSLAPGSDRTLEWREWEAQDGTKRQAIDIIADSVQFLNSRGEQGDPGDDSADEPDFQPVPVPAGVPGVTGADDDIPF